MSLFQGMTVKQPQNVKGKPGEHSKESGNCKKETASRSTGADQPSKGNNQSAFSFLLEGQGFVISSEDKHCEESLSNSSLISSLTMGQNASTAASNAPEILKESQKEEEEEQQTESLSYSLLTQGNILVDRIKQKLRTASDVYDPYSIIKYSKGKNLDPSSIDDVKFVETDSKEPTSNLYPDLGNLFSDSSNLESKLKIPKVRPPGSVKEDGNTQDAAYEGATSLDVVAQFQYNLDYSSDEKFQILQQVHSLKVSSLQDRQQLLQSEVKKITCGRIQMIMSLAEKHHQLRHLQEQQLEAVMEEDYEKAESFGKECSTLEAEINILPELSLNTHFIMSELLKSAMELHAKQLNARKRMVSETNKMKASEENLLENILRSISKMEQKSVSDVDEMTQELENDKSIFDSSQKEYHQKEEHLQSRINKKTQSYVERKQEIMEEKQTVEEEIAELEKKLEILRQRQLDLADAIDEQDKLVTMATLEFKEDISGLESDHQSLQIRDAELKERQQALNSFKEKFDDDINARQERKARHEMLISELAHVLETEEKSLQDFPEDVSWSVKGPPSFSLSETYLSLNSNFKEKEDQTRRLSRELLQGQKKVVSLKQKVSDLEGHIADLHHIKQLAVDGKEFSEAKKLSEEIKSVTEEGKKYQAEMEKEVHKNQELHKAIQDMQDKCKELKEKADEEKRVWEVELKDRMIDHFQTLYDDQEQSIVKHNCAVQAILMSELQTSCLLLNHLCEKLDFSLPEEVNDQVQKILDDIDKLEVNPSQEKEKETRDEEFSKELGELDSALHKAVEVEDFQKANIQIQITNLENAKLVT